MILQNIFRRFPKGMVGLFFASFFLCAGIAHAATVATPSFSPAAGTYTSAQTVTITSTTSGASIRYTIDGTTPSATAGTVYSAPVSIGATTTLKAIAYKSGSTSSSVTSGTYTINLPTAVAPVFSPIAGTFTNAQTVAITSTTSGASIRYTVDGTAPSTTVGTVYSTPVSIGATTTLKAIAYKTGYNASAVVSGVYTINLPTTSAPTFSPVAGTYTSVQTVTISSATSGASIRYTADGSTPTATTGTVYSAAVTVNATTTLKAIAYKTGYNASTVTSSLYTINLPTVAAPVFGPVAGTYTSAQTVAITSTTSGASIRYTTDGSTPTTTTGTLYTTSVSIGATTTLKAIAYLTGYNNSTVTSGTYTINIPQTAAPAFSPAAGTYTSIQTVAITSTTSGASIRYTTDGSTPTATTGTIYSAPVSIGATATLKAIAYKSGYTDSTVTSGLYTINLPTAAAPTFNPVAGTYTSVQTVAITSSTSGAAIRYTIDGSTPTATTGTVYSTPVSVSATTTLKAIAYKTGYNNSTVTSGAYTINLTAAAPTFSPAAATYTSPQTVAITSATGGASIRYTIDGTTPNATAGTLYTVPVSIGATTTLKAIAYATGYASSTVTSGTYTINLPTAVAPAFSPVAGSYTSAQSVTIASTTSGASIRYTTDGSAPSATVGTVYTAPVSIAATTTLKAIAYLNGYKNSTVTSGTYTISLPKTSTPTFSPSAGSYSYSPSVTISTSTSGASIIYTIDGTIPTHSGTTITNGTLCTGEVLIEATTTLKALAFLAGYADSSVANGIYTLNFTQLAVPIVAPASGTYSTDQSVGIILDPEDFGSDYGVRVAYTVDGSTPSARGGTLTHGISYTGSFTVSTPMTVKAISYAPDFTPSQVVSTTLAFGSAAATPVFSPPAGSYSGTQNVAITSSTSGASIIYTTDGTTPTLAYGTLYSAPISLASTTMLKATAYVSGTKGFSPVNSGLYDISSAHAAVVNVLHDFSPSDNGGFSPGNAGVIQAADGDFYGTTGGGGTLGQGTVYRMSPSGAFSTLATFNGPNGANPQSSLFQDTDGTFYGTTYAGGSSGFGTIFKLTPSGSLTTLYSFSSADGACPKASLIKATDGNFYGATFRGGNTSSFPFGYGTLFKITPAGGLTTLALSGSPGPLLQSPNGCFYVVFDQDFGFGYIDILTPSGVLITLHSFSDSSIGNGLNSGLVRGSDGNFYGTTKYGSSNEGTVYKIDPQGTLTTLGVFDGTNGSTPEAGLVCGSNGNFYGSTSGGWLDGAISTLFRITPSGTLTNLYSFDDLNGFSPLAALIQGKDGYFYGTTSSGGLYNLGVIYQLIIPTTAAPFFTPPPGAYYSGVQPISIATTTAGATIRYTTDGSTPSATDGTIYTVPISLPTSATLKAIATTSGLDDSPITSGAYLLSPPVGAPVFNPAPGTYTDAQTVSITSATSNALIRVTTDGSIPSSTNGDLYSAPIVVRANTTLSAFAYNADDPDSPVVVGNYIINKPPVITPNPTSNGSVVGTNTPVTISFTATDADGGITKIDIYRNGTLVNTLGRPTTGATWTFSEVTGLAPGIYTYVAVAYDTQGVSTTTSSVTINVLPGLPYSSGFESEEGYALGSLNGQKAWSVTAGTAQIIDASAAYGSRAVALKGNSDATRIEQRIAITGVYTEPLYIDLCTKPAVGTNVNSSTILDFDVCRVAFVVNGTKGQLVALDGDQAGDGTWKPLAAFVDLDSDHVTATWHRVSLCLNRFYKTYDLYLDGRLIVSGSPFRISSMADAFLVAVQNGAAADTLFDGLSVGLAPLTPTITNISGASRSVALEWTPLTCFGTINYQIERKDGAGAFAKIGEVANLFTYIDRTVADGESYTYRVRVCTSGEWSPYSTEQSVTTLPFPRTGLKLWLDASSCAPGAVSTWTDRNDPTVKAQQTSSARQPLSVAGVLNGYPVVRFDGIDDSLSLTNVMSGASAGEILGVVSVTTLDGTVVNRLWSFGTGSGSSYYNSSRYEDFGTNENNPHTGSPLSDQFHITDVSASNGALCERVNSVVNWSRDGASIGFNPTPVIGGSLSDANTVFNGDIAELLVYNRELTPAERILINEYLVDKYALPSVPVPGAPNLSAQANLNNQVLLSWTAQAETLYTTTLIERSTSDGEFIALAEVEKGTTYVDSPVITGGHYSYRIRSKGLAGISGYSNTVALIVPISTSIISTTNGSGLTAVSGDWTVDGTSLVAHSIRGSINYNLSVSIAGLYALDIIVRDAYLNNPSSCFTLDVVIDGIALGTLNIAASGVTSGTGHLTLPWLTAGAHTVKLVWHNGRAGTFLRVDAIQLVDLDPTDGDNNGEPDWMAPYFDSTFAFDGTPVQTYVSPYTIEGKSAYPLFVKLNSVYQTTPVSPVAELTVRQGLSRQFFSDVPLNSSAPVKITAVEANGLRIGTKTVTWKSLNLASLVSSTMTVRKDSRILVEASDPLAPDIIYQLRIVSPDSSSSEPSLAPSEKLEVLFDQVGDYQIYRTPANGAEVKALTVTVRQLSLSPVPTLFSGRARIYKWGQLPAGPTIQTDPSMVVTPYGTPAVRQTFMITANSTSRAILRLDGETGPIVDAVTVEPIRCYNDEESIAQQVATLPDGTTIYRFSLNFEGTIPADLYVVIQSFTGAPFSDGSLEKKITAADIDADGRYTYYLYVKNGGTATCHTVTVYNGSNEILYSY